MGYTSRVIDTGTNVDEVIEIDREVDFEADPDTEQQIQNTDLAQVLSSNFSIHRS